MEVTAKTLDGKEIYKEERHYQSQSSTSRDTKMIYGAQWKAGFIRDTSLQPFKPKKETFEINLPEGVRTVDVTVELYYELAHPGQKFPIHTVTKRESLDR